MEAKKTVNLSDALIEDQFGRIFRMTLVLRSFGKSARRLQLSGVHDSTRDSFRANQKSRVEKTGYE